jgi:hypothetical protein
MSSKRASASALVPNAISAGDIKAGTTIPEVDTAAGEVAWNSTTAYTGVENNVNHGGRLWSSIAPSTNVVPGTDTSKWRTSRPSNRMAPFDDQINTMAQGTGSMTYVLQPGFFDGLALYGLQGGWLQITIKDSPGGSVIYDWEGDLYEQAAGLYEYLFMPLRMLTKKVAHNLSFAPDAELTITVTAANNGPVAIGMIVCGFWANLTGDGTSTFLGGVEYGATAQIKTYSYIKTEEDGSTRIIPRNSATNLSCQVVIDGEQANYAADVLSKIAARPVAIILSNMPRYDYLNTFGLVSGTVQPVAYSMAKVDLDVKGFI